MADDFGQRLIASFAVLPAFTNEGRHQVFGRPTFRIGVVGLATLGPLVKRWHPLDRHREIGKMVLDRRMAQQTDRGELAILAVDGPRHPDRLPC